jgi:hypothetical protein
MLRQNSHTSRANIGARFALGETFITPGAQEALDIAGQTAIQFLRRHMSADWGEVSEDDAQENKVSLRDGFRLLSAYRTVKGQKIYVMWNKGSDVLSRLSLDFGLAGFHFIYPAVGAVGTVGNSTFFVEFSKRCGNGGKTRFVFHGFHSAAVSNSLFFSPGGLFPRSHTF